MTEPLSQAWGQDRGERGADPAPRVGAHYEGPLQGAGAVCDT